MCAGLFLSAVGGACRARHPVLSDMFALVPTCLPHAVVVLWLCCGCAVAVAVLCCGCAVAVLSGMFALVPTCLPHAVVVLWLCCGCAVAVAVLCCGCAVAVLSGMFALVPTCLPHIDRCMQFDGLSDSDSRLSLSLSWLGFDSRRAPIQGLWRTCTRTAPRRRSTQTARSCIATPMATCSRYLPTSAPCTSTRTRGSSCRLGRGASWSGSLPPGILDLGLLD